MTLRTRLGFVGIVFSSMVSLHAQVSVRRPDSQQLGRGGLPPLITPPSTMRRNS
jgi:hypothetical protein